MSLKIRNAAEFTKRLYKAANIAIDGIIMATNAACLDCITLARSLPSPPDTFSKQPHQPNYIDHTGNLRQSIGAVVFFGGKEIWSSFGEGEGGLKGKNFATEIATAEIAEKKLCGIIVAGMEYAKYVEDNGYDVITGSTLQLTDLLKKRLSEAKNAINDYKVR